MGAIEPAYAASPMSIVLCKIFYMTQGNLGRGLATLGIAALGAGAMVGKTSWASAITFAVGIGILFGADHIAIILLNLSTDPCPGP